LAVPDKFLKQRQTCAKRPGGLSPKLNEHIAITGDTRKMNFE
jgi:hypothetical protein